MKRTSALKIILVILFFIAVSIIAGKLLTNFSHFEYIKNLVQNHYWIFIIILLFIKTVGIVWPPLPGGIFTLAAVPLIGWKEAFLVDFVGSAMGTTIAFYLGRKFGEKVIVRLFPNKVLKFIKRIRVNKQNELEGVFFVSLATGFFMVEVTSYGFGYLKLTYKNFITGTLAAQAARGIPAFYFFGSFVSGRDVTLNLILLLISVPPIALAWRKYVHFDSLDQ